MALSKLDAVNLILRKIGEIPVTNIDEPYPTLAIALPALDEARDTILSEGFWFNTYYKHVLQPDVDGRVATPADCLKFFPEVNRYAWNGTCVVLQDTGEVYHGEPVTGRLIYDIDFEELPEVARYAIAFQAALDVYVSDIGPDSNSEALKQKAQAYYEQLGGDHTVSRKLNSRQRKQQWRWRSQLRT